jgi:hypothetical protein
MGCETWNRLTGSLVNALPDGVCDFEMVQFTDDSYDFPPYNLSEQLGIATNLDAAAKHIAQIINSGNDVTPTPVVMAPPHGVKPTLHRRVLSLTRSTKRALVHLPRSFNRFDKQREAVDSVWPPSQRFQPLARQDVHDHHPCSPAPPHIRPIASLNSLYIQSRYLLYHPFLTWTIDTINSSDITSLTLLWPDFGVSSRDWSSFSVVVDNTVSIMVKDLVGSAQAQRCGRLSLSTSSDVFEVGQNHTHHRF